MGLELIVEDVQVDQPVRQLLDLGGIEADALHLLVCPVHLLLHRHHLRLVLQDFGLQLLLEVLVLQLQFLLQVRDLQPEVRFQLAPRQGLQGELASRLLRLLYALRKLLLQPLHQMLVAVDLRAQLGVGLLQQVRLLLQRVEALLVVADLLLEVVVFVGHKLEPLLELDGERPDIEEVARLHGHGRPPSRSHKHLEHDLELPDANLDGYHPLGPDVLLLGLGHGLDHGRPDRLPLQLLDLGLQLRYEALVG